MQDWSRRWKINLGKAPLGTSVFTLMKHRSDAFIYYTMDFEKGGDEAWRDCALVQRGVNHLTWAPLNPLPPWEPQHENAYVTGVNNFLVRVAASTRRLTGEVLPMTPPPSPPDEAIVDGTVTPHQVTILLAKDAVKVNQTTRRDLLIVITESEGLLVSSEGGPGGPDGTALGDPS